MPINLDKLKQRLIEAQKVTEYECYWCGKNVIKSSEPDHEKNCVMKPLTKEQKTSLNEYI